MKFYCHPFRERVSESEEWGCMLTAYTKTLFIQLLTAVISSYLFHSSQVDFDKSVFCNIEFWSLIGKLLWSFQKLSRIHQCDKWSFWSFIIKFLPFILVTLKICAPHHPLDWISWWWVTINLFYSRVFLAFWIFFFVCVCVKIKLRGFSTSSVRIFIKAN